MELNAYIKKEFREIGKALNKSICKNCKFWKDQSSKKIKTNIPVGACYEIPIMESDGIFKTDKKGVCHVKFIPQQSTCIYTPGDFGCDKFQTK